MQVNIHQFKPLIYSSHLNCLLITIIIDEACHILLLTSDTNFQLNIICEFVIMFQVRKGLRVLGVVINKKWFKSLHGNYPWRDGGAQVLCQERSKRHILPFLDVSCFKKIKYEYLNYVGVMFILSLLSLSF